jgi:hypothetical protein
VAALPASQAVAVSPALAAWPTLLHQERLESVERAASPEASAPARQASRYSDSLFRQPLISFFILSFLIGRNRAERVTKQGIQTHASPQVNGPFRTQITGSGRLLLCISAPFFIVTNEDHPLPPTPKRNNSEIASPREPRKPQSFAMWRIVRQEHRRFADPGAILPKLPALRDLTTNLRLTNSAPVGILYVWHATGFCAELHSGL